MNDENDIGSYRKTTVTELYPKAINSDVVNTDKVEININISNIFII